VGESRGSGGAIESQASAFAAQATALNWTLDSSIVLKPLDLNLIFEIFMQGRTTYITTIGRQFRIGLIVPEAPNKALL
jgi:hypothetical protein